MVLIKLLIALVTIHLGFGFTQMVVSYFGGDVADYGAAGWVSHTPIGTFIDLEDAPQSAEDGVDNPNNLVAIFQFVNNLGDAINGLATFGYGFLQEIDPDDGLVYMVVMGFRIVSTMFWLALGMGMVKFLFESNLLTSKLGLGIVGLGVGIGSLSAVGAVF